MIYIYIDVESVPKIKTVKEHHSDLDLSIEKVKKQDS